MLRDLTGSYAQSVAGGELVRAFVPQALPPMPPLELTGVRQRLLERATLALGRLDSVTIHIGPARKRTGRLELALTA